MFNFVQGQEMRSATELWRITHRNTLSISRIKIELDAEIGQSGTF